MNKPQSGNMLVYILGAIFLLGILLVALRSGYQPGAGIDAEANILKVTQVRKYATELERGVGFIMSNGKSETDIRFAHVSNPGAYGTPGDTPDRQVFETTGGGVVWKSPPTGIQTTTTAWVFSGANDVVGVGASGCGDATCVDLLAILPNVTKDFCLALNDSAGVTNTTGNPPADVGSVDITTLFPGTFSAGGIINSATSTDLFSKKEGCFEGAGTPASGTYHYYRVLYVR